MISIAVGGPTLVGGDRIVNGKTIDTPRLRLGAYGRFMPEQLGLSG